MSVRVFGAGALSLSFLLLAAAAGHAQTPSPPPPLAPQPVTGFVPPYEIMHHIRAAGFEPVAPPLREGTTYVLRATDFRGILMRVVVDARSGAIRDVNRIVPGPGRYGQIEMPPQSYGSPPPYGRPVYDEPDIGASEDAQPWSRSPAARAAARPSLSALPPLPRPRPAALASRKAGGDAKSRIKADIKLDPKVDAKTGTNFDAKPEVKSDAAAAPAPPSSAPTKVPAIAPLND